jgi:hypothetical protein
VGEVEEVMDFAKPGLDGYEESLFDQEGPAKQVAADSSTGVMLSVPLPAHGQGSHRRRPDKIQWEGEKDDDPTRKRPDKDFEAGETLGQDFVSSQPQAHQPQDRLR